MFRCWLFLLAAVATAATADQRPVLSLVIDDLGYSLDNGLAAIRLDGHHTYAILPASIYGRELAESAHRHGKEVILHLPMQSISSSAAQEPNALNEAMDEDQLTSEVHSLLGDIPFIRGVNNHMGSHLTEFDFFMRPVMDSIRSYNPGLYFLDSRTSPRSVAFAEARDAGLKSTSRDVFLDYDKNPESIRVQFHQWLAKARELGSAIAIGHPFRDTIDVLRTELPRAHDEFRFLPISELIEAREQRGFSVNWREQLSQLETR